MRTLRDIELDPPSAGENGVPQVPDTTSLQFALARMLTDGVSRLDVIDAERRPVGTVRLQKIMDSIGPATAPEQAGSDPARV